MNYLMDHLTCYEIKFSESLVRAYLKEHLWFIQFLWLKLNFKLTCIPKAFRYGLLFCPYGSGNQFLLKSEMSAETQTHTFLNFFCVLFQSVHLSLTPLQQIIVEDFLYFASFIDYQKNVCDESLPLKGFDKLFKTYWNSKINLAPVSQDNLCKERLFENKLGRFLDEIHLSKERSAVTILLPWTGNFRIKKGPKIFYRENRDDSQKGKLILPLSVFLWAGKHVCKKSKRVIPAIDFWISQFSLL